MQVNIFVTKDKDRRTDTGMIRNMFEINETVDIFLKYHDEIGTFNIKQHMLTAKFDTKKYIIELLNF